MKLIDSFKLSILNIKRNKKVIMYITLLSLMTILSVGVLVFKNNVYKIIDTTKNNEIGYRTIRVFNKDNNSIDDKTAFFEQLKSNTSDILKIKHVQDAYIGEEALLVVDTNLSNKYLDGKITVLRGTENTLPKIIKGRKFSDNESGVIVCPEKFFPHSEAGQIKNNWIIDGNELLNKKIDVKYKEYNYDDINNILVVKKEYKKEFKVIGLYHTYERMNDNGTCYISPIDMNEMAAVEYSWDTSAYISSSISVIVDDVDNMEYVKNVLINNGYELTGVEAYLDYNVINTIITSITVAIVLILLIIMIISSSYLKKKLISEEKEIKILISLGFRKKDMITCFLIENLIIGMIALTLGLIMFYILFLICTSHIGILISTSLMLGGFAVGLDSFVITFVLIIIIPLLVSVYHLNNLFSRGKIE